MVNHPSVGHPDLFVTFTGNPNWEEIVEQQRGAQTWADNPDIAVRVFLAKLKKFKEVVIQKGQVFGKVNAYAYSIELQQRGMPHVHMLLTLAKEDKPDTPPKT